MTKQEEIREGMAIRRYNRNHIYAMGWMDLSNAERSLFLDDVDKDFTYLHSQGVVIKVVTEPPINPYSATVIAQEDVGKWLGYHKALEDLADCVVVEPLV